MKKINHIPLPLLNEWKVVSKAFVVLLSLTLLISGCSVESKLNRSYKGKSFSEVMAKMGAPTNIENLIGGGTIRSYVNKKMLRETPINTGHFQYDEFNSPKVLKSEITQFTVDPDGKVKEIKYSCEYSR
jgi:hypothetical protein